MKFHTVRSLFLVGMTLFLVSCSKSNNPTSTGSSSSPAPTPTPIIYSPVSAVYFNITNNTLTGLSPGPITIVDAYAGYIPNGYSSEGTCSILTGQTASVTLYIPFSANYTFGVGYYEGIIAGTYNDYSDYWNSVQLTPGNTYTLTVGDNTASLNSIICNECFL